VHALRPAHPVHSHDCHLHRQAGAGHTLVLCLDCSAAAPARLCFSLHGAQPPTQQLTPLLACAGFGVIYNGTVMSPAGPGNVLILNDTAPTAGVKIVPAAVPKTAPNNGGLFNMVFGGICRVDSVTTYVYCPNDGSAGNTTNEQVRKWAGGTHG
jgi:hypothetical protein